MDAGMCDGLGKALLWIIGIAFVFILGVGLFVGWLIFK